MPRGALARGADVVPLALLAKAILQDLARSGGILTIWVLPLFRAKVFLGPDELAELIVTLPPHGDGKHPLSALLPADVKIVDSFLLQQDGDAQVLVPQYDLLPARLAHGSRDVECFALLLRVGLFRVG